MHGLPMFSHVFVVVSSCFLLWLLKTTLKGYHRQLVFVFVFVLFMESLLCNEGICFMLLIDAFP
ncbi:hypothetical protein SDJN02_15180 [Cucurbita argyrosperma subsp. argyrosperma]|nr:hypothetical protein SDJN02_15180 [Cucurbita argyrosperma subsp. argyrosperma]